MVAFLAVRRWRIATGFPYYWWLMPIFALWALALCFDAVLVIAHAMVIYDHGPPRLVEHAGTFLAHAREYSYREVPHAIPWLGIGAVLLAGAVHARDAVRDGMSKGRAWSLAWRRPLRACFGGRRWWAKAGAWSIALSGIVFVAPVVEREPRDWPVSLQLLAVRHHPIAETRHRLAGIIARNIAELDLRSVEVLAEAGNELALARLVREDPEGKWPVIRVVFTTDRSELDLVFSSLLEELREMEPQDRLPLLRDAVDLAGAGRHWRFWHLLAESQGPEATIEDCRRLLEIGGYTERRLASDLLYYVVDHVDPAVDVLVDHLRHDPDMKIRKNGTYLAHERELTLVRDGDDRAILAYLESLMSGADSDDQWFAITTLRRYPDPRFDAVLERAKPLADQRNETHRRMTLHYRKYLRLPDSDAKLDYLDEALTGNDSSRFFVMRALHEFLADPDPRVDRILESLIAHPKADVGTARRMRWRRRELSSERRP